MKLLSGLFLAFLSVCLNAVRTEAGIMMSTSNVYAEAYDAISNGNAIVFTGSAIPTHTTLDPVNGDAYSKNAIIGTRVVVKPSSR